MKVKQNKRLLKVFLAVLIVVLVLIGIIVLINYFFTDNFFGRLSNIKDKLSERVETNLDVHHYDLSFEIDNKNKSINGIAKINFSLKNSDEKLKLDFYDNFNINALTLNNEPADYVLSDNELVIKSDKMIKDSSEIMIEYKGTPQNLGLGSFNFGNYQGKPFVYSLSEPVFASSWFPCNDIPNDKATLEMKITNDSSLVSISNGRLIGIQTIDSMRTYHYRTDYPISSYLIAIYSGDYIEFNDYSISTVTQDSMELRYYVTPNKLEAAKKDFSVHPKIFEVFTKLFGDYPFKDDGYGVAQFWWDAGAMEHQTITGISHNFISGNQFYTDFLVHEVAHHWWGNAVGPKTWRDIWLNEGFSTYSEALFWENTKGFEALQSTMNSFTGAFDQTTLYNPGIYMFSRLIYEKGAWVLHMLRRELGDKIFFECLRNYFEKYRYKNAETDDFLKLCEKVSSRKLNWFFDQWVYNGVGVIELDYKWQAINEAIELNIVQTQSGFEKYRYLIDVLITTSEGINNSFTFNITSSDTTIVIPESRNISHIELNHDSWLLADIENLNIEKQ